MDLYNNLDIRRGFIRNITVFENILHPKLQIDYKLWIDKIVRLPLPILSKVVDLCNYRLNWCNYRTDRYYRESYQYPTCDGWGSERIIYDFERFLGAITTSHIIKQELLQRTERQQVEDLVDLDLPLLSNNAAKFILNNLKEYSKFINSYGSIVINLYPFDEMVMSMYTTCQFKEELMMELYKPERVFKKQLESSQHLSELINFQE